MGSGFAYAPAYVKSRGLPSPRFIYLPASLHCLPPQSGSVSPDPYSGFRHPLSNSALAWTVARWCWNINQLCIDYASRPRLSSRLTLGGLAFSARSTLRYHALLLRHPQLRLCTWAPLHYPRRITRPVSYYALFQGWLLLSQPPGCLCNPTSFTT